jgi:hypothetical protein
MKIMVLTKGKPPTQVDVFISDKGLILFLILNLSIGNTVL